MYIEEKQNIDVYNLDSISVTFTDKDGNSFEAKTGEGSYDGCRLRES